MKSMELEKTDKTVGKLLEMARELNQWDGSCDWAGTFDIDSADDFLTGMKPSGIIRAMFFGDIEDGVSYTDAQMRFDAYGNLEIISSYSLENEAWDYRDDIIDDYRNKFGGDRLDECLSEMDETHAIV